MKSHQPIQQKEHIRLVFFCRDLYFERLVPPENIITSIRSALSGKVSFNITIKSLIMYEPARDISAHFGDVETLIDRWIRKYQLNTIYCYVVQKHQYDQMYMNRNIKLMDFQDYTSPTQIGNFNIPADSDFDPVIREKEFNEGIMPSGFVKKKAQEKIYDNISEYTHNRQTPSNNSINNNQSLASNLSMLKPPKILAVRDIKSKTTPKSVIVNSNQPSKNDTKQSERLKITTSQFSEKASYNKSISFKSSQPSNPKPLGTKEYMQSDPNTKQFITNKISENINMNKSKNYTSGQNVPVKPVHNLILKQTPAQIRMTHNEVNNIRENRFLQQRNIPLDSRLQGIRIKSMSKKP